MTETTNKTIQTDKLFRVLARKIEYYNRVKSPDKQEFIDANMRSIETIEKLLPHGSGIDTGCNIDLQASSENRIVIHFGFHHMNDAGYYDGWTQHKLIITPSLSNEFDLRITGKNRNGIKEYLYDVFNFALTVQIDRF